MREQSRVVVLENCVYCHAALVDSIASHQSDPQLRNDCISCHAGVGHGPSQ